MGSDTIKYDILRNFNPTTRKYAYGPPAALHHSWSAAAHYPTRQQSSEHIFSDEDYQFFRDALVDASVKHDLAIHAYVWMTITFICWQRPARSIASARFFNPWGAATYSISTSTTNAAARCGKADTGRRWWTASVTC